MQLIVWLQLGEVDLARRWQRVRQPASASDINNREGETGVLIGSFPLIVLKRDPELKFG